MYEMVDIARESNLLWHQMQIEIMLTEERNLDSMLSLSHQQRLSLSAPATFAFSHLSCH